MEIRIPAILWLAALLNILPAVIGHVVFWYLFLTGRLPPLVKYSGSYIAFVVEGLNALLVVSSAAALFGKSGARQIMLVSAILVYCISIFQKVDFLYRDNKILSDLGRAQVHFLIALAVLELMVNVWVLGSAKVIHFFALKSENTNAKLSD